MEDEDEERAEEERRWRGRKEGDDDQERRRHRKSGPAGVSCALCLRVGQRQELERLREGGRKAGAFDAMRAARVESRLRTRENSYTTTTAVVGSDPSMNCCLADEAVGTVNRIRILIVWIAPTNDKALVIESLIADGVRVE